MLARQNLVADNTYLSLLVETGLLGLGVFAALNVAILRTALRAARTAGARASFFGSWIFCFWCGELVQMLSGYFNYVLAGIAGLFLGSGYRGERVSF